MPSNYNRSGKPLRKRGYHVFLSHAHVDKEAILRLRNWLALAGLNVWYDAEQVPGGALFPTAIAQGIGDCQSMLVAVSDASIKSGWVEEELSQGVVHSREFKPFPIIPLRLENCELPEALRARSAVDAFDAFDGTLTGTEASRLLASIHGLPDATPPAEATRQIVQMISAESGELPDPLEQARCPALYVSFGWRDSGNEPALRLSVCRALDGFCLVGDAVDHPNTDPLRVAAIMAGCSAHVVVIPLRASGRLEDREYKSLRSEIRTGAEAGLAQHFIIEKGVVLERPDAASVVEVSPSAPGHAWADALEPWVDALRRAPPSSRRPHYVFVATDYDDLVVKDHVVRHISKVTGLPCLKGNDFLGKIPARKIEHALRGASLVIANIVSHNLQSGLPDVNWNTCIEAGMAIGSGRPNHVIARRAATDTWTIRDNLPFMIRDNSIATYADDASLIALIHRFCRPYRRRVLNTSGPI